MHSSKETNSSASRQVSLSTRGMLGDADAATEVERRVDGVSSVDSDLTRRIRIGFVCAGNPDDVLTWSGTPKHMLRALEREFDVTLVIRRPWRSGAQVFRRLVRRWSKGKIDLLWSRRWSRRVAVEAVNRLKSGQCDVVFVVGATAIGAELVDHIPTVFVSDATLTRMLNYNPRFSALTPGLKQSAKILEDRCIQHSVLSVFPSEWASSSAINDHGGDQKRVLNIPWGANIHVNQFIKPEMRSDTEWRILFVGTNWVGKGGDIALQAIQEMKSLRYNVHLDIVGSSPDVRPDLDYVTFHGFINKQDAAGAARIEALFMAAHIFFLPTLFEALGIVFAEAASLGIPSVSYATGGVPGMVQDNVTGILLPEGAPPTAFARALIDLLSDRSKYLAMCHAALDASRTTLNWNAWAERVRKELEERFLIS